MESILFLLIIFIALCGLAVLFDKVMDIEIEVKDKEDVVIDIEAYNRKKQKIS